MITEWGRVVLTFSTDQSSMAKSNPRYDDDSTLSCPSMRLPGLLKSMQDRAISDVLSNPTVVWARPLTTQAVDGGIPSSAMPNW